MLFLLAFLAGSSATFPPFTSILQKPDIRTGADLLEHIHNGFSTALNVFRLIVSPTERIRQMPEELLNGNPDILSDQPEPNEYNTRSQLEESSGSASFFRSGSIETSGSSASGQLSYGPPNPPAAPGSVQLFVPNKMPKVISLVA